ncbi:hypothetical protein PHLCEN_2v11857 [Hermanssonia centrifuga]|uniref:Glutathione S-transferase UstS-like C-terminal domain-containing protein n=1 Tax=Hermanssonia centrifuga TaxID=98765 RepID=A0A2R6NIQ6_9APHY|nr:hypothetical protein PHLCEN_2v11857 [Hermanssonia centrifuga]
MFLGNVAPTISLPLLKILFHRQCTGLNDPSEKYFRSTREKMFGKKLEDMGGEEEWNKLEPALAKLNGWLSANGPGRDNLLTGDRIIFADIQLASLLIWAKVVCGEDSEDWKRLASLHDGKWKRFLAQFEKYGAVDI